MKSKAIISLADENYYNLLLELINSIQNFPESKKYFYYNGSLTTPPFTEHVNWFIFNETITISVDQVNKLRDLMPIGNYRDEHPLNDRKVTSNQ